MPGGRPRKAVSVSTGKIGKAAKSARAAQESKLKVPRNELKAPEWLSFESKKEFARVVREAGQIGLLDNMDLSVLAIYAHSWALYVNCARHLEDEGLTIFKPTKLGEIEVPSPYVGIQEKAAKQIMQCSSKLGLATTDRLKLIVPEAEEKPQNKFLQYVN